MQIIRFDVGDVLEMKKEHPCHSKMMRVLRTGSDIRIVCTVLVDSELIPIEKVDQSAPLLEEESIWNVCLAFDLS